MIETCPKCAYVRKETDEAPEWKCPSCGIAMAKYIALQKEVAERKFAQQAPPRGRAPGQFEVMKPQPALGMLDDGESLFRRRALRLVLWVIAMAVVAVVRSLMVPHKDAPAPPANAGTAGPAALQPSFPAVPQAPAPAREPELPVDSLKEAFETAHRDGEATAIMTVGADSHGVPGLDTGKLMKAHVERREVFAPAGCDRFGVTLTQGGGERTNARGQNVKTAYSMHFVYALNYCLDGTAPVAGRDLKVEAER